MKIKGVRIVQFYLLNPNREYSPIYLSFRYNNKRLQCSVGESIECRLWDKAKSRPKTQVKNYHYLNQLLNRINEIVVSYYYKRMEEGIIPSPQSIKEHLFATLHREEEVPTQKDFFAYFDEFIEAKKIETKEATIKKYQTTKQKLIDFSKSKKYKLTFDSINLNFESKLKNYLLELPASKTKYGNEGMLNDTISKYISVIKTFMAFANDREWTKNEAYKKFKADKAPRHDIITLTEKEIELLEAYNTQSKRLEQVRDLFLFMLFTLQRWSDIEQFSKKQVKNFVWTFHAKKTGEKISVPLNTPFTAKAKEIAEKYDYNLPKITSQKFNLYLKELGLLAGIVTEMSIKRKTGATEIEITKPKYEFLSAHTARRTGTTLLLQRGVPATTVMLLTGHEDFKTLMKYENTSQEVLFETLSQIDLKKPLMVVSKKSA